MADCTQLGNIAALNGNSVNVGSGSGNHQNPVNNGQMFVNQCNISGISVLDCSQLLNLAVANGNNISISLDALNSFLNALGLPTGLAAWLKPEGSGLVALTTDLW